MAEWRRPRLHPRGSVGRWRHSTRRVCSSRRRADLVGGTIPSVASASAAAERVLAAGPEVLRSEAVAAPQTTQARRRVEVPSAEALSAEGAASSGASAAVEHP